MFDAPLVFAGYGITAKDLKRGDETFTYDDYAGIDVKGKVVILSARSRSKRTRRARSTAQTTQHAPFTRKLANASEHGAAAVIFVNDGLELVTRREQNAKLLKAALDKLAELRDKLAAASPTDAGLKSWQATSEKAAAEAAELSKAADRQPGHPAAVHGRGRGEQPPQAAGLFLHAGRDRRSAQGRLGKDLAALEGEIDSDLVPRSAELAGWRAARRNERHREEGQGEKRRGRAGRRRPAGRRDDRRRRPLRPSGPGRRGLARPLDHRHPQRRRRQRLRHGDAPGNRPPPGEQRRKSRSGGSSSSPSRAKNAASWAAPTTPASRGSRWKRPWPCSTSTWSAGSPTTSSSSMAPAPPRSSIRSSNACAES